MLCKGKEAKWRGLVDAKRVVDLYGTPRWTGEIVLPPTNSYSQGDLIEVTSSSNNVSNQKLRIIEINYYINETILKLEEDEATIQ